MRRKRERERTRKDQLEADSSREIPKISAEESREKLKRVPECEDLLQLAKFQEESERKKQTEREKFDKRL